MIGRLALTGLQAATARTRRRLERETARRTRPPPPAVGGPLRVALFAKYPAGWAGTKYRLGKWAERLAAAGHTVHLELPLPSPDAERLSGDFSLAARWEYHRALLGRRLAAVTSSVESDVVVLHMTDLPFWEYGEPFVAQALRRVSGHVVLDLDDLPVVGGSQVLGPRARALVGAVDGVICGTGDLLPHVAETPAWVIPTCVEPAEWSVPDRSARRGPAVLGWVGSIGNAVYLERLAPVLAEVCARHGARVRVVGGRPPALPGVPVDFVPWTAAGEIRDLEAMDIGLAPLADGPMERCKCGLKALQYMASGLPVVASPVAALGRIVRDGETGLHATTVTDWTAALDRLLGDLALRRQMGAAGRAAAERDWSFDAHATRYDEALRGRSPDRPGRDSLADA